MAGARGRVKAEPGPAPASSEPLALAHASLRLTVTRGPAAGVKYDAPLGATDLTLGRAKRADVCMRDDTTVSEAHARLARSPGGSWTLRDVGSSNGTAVNGVRLARGGDAVELADDDVLTFGDAQARVEIPTPMVPGMTVMEYMDAEGERMIRVSLARIAAAEADLLQRGLEAVAARRRTPTIKSDSVAKAQG